MGKNVFLFIIAGLMTAGFAFFQASQTGTISGVVRTHEGDPLPGVIVLCKSPALDLPEIEAVTSVSGVYGFPRLSPGTYELMFIFAGLRHVERKGIAVLAGGSVSLDIDLPLRAKDESPEPPSTCKDCQDDGRKNLNLSKN